MKKIKFTCSSCEAKLRVPTHLAGVSAPCPKCGATITAPTDLDHVIEEAPRSTSRSNAVARPRTAPAAKPAASPQRVVSGSVLAAPTSLQNQEPASPEHEALPVSRSQAPTPAERQSVLHEPELPQEISAPPAPSLPVPEPSTTVSEQLISDSEPELIVTEERLIPPSPKPIQPSEAPPIAEIPPAYPAIEEPEVPQESLAPVQKTQPIRINPRPDDFLPPRAEVDSDAQELPRLDVNLASASETAAPAAGPSFGETPPKRVQLPQVGETIEAFSPDDFFAPEQPTAEAYSAAVPSPLDEIPDQAEPPLPEEWVYESSPELEEPTYPEPAEPAAQLSWENEQADAEVDSEVEEWSRQFRQESEIGNSPHKELVSLDDSLSTGPIPHPDAADQFSIEDPGMSSPTPEFPFDDGLPEQLDDLPHAPQEDYPGDENALHEGSFENLLSQRIEPAEAGPLLDTPSQSQVVSPDFPFQPPSQEVPRPVATEQEMLESRTDADVLDEMFGSSAGTGRMKKSTMVMLSIIAAVAIIATISVIVIINALGGVNPYPEMAEKAVPPPYSSIEEGSKPNDPVSPEGTIYQEPDLDDAPAIIDPVAKDRIEPNLSGLPAIETPEDPPVAVTPDQIDTSAPSLGVGTSAAADVENVDSTLGTSRTIGREDPALTFDERLEETMNRLNGVGPENSNTTGTAMNLSNATSGSGGGEAALLGAAAGIVAAAQGSSETGQNYNPPASFPAPDGSEGSRLGKTHDLLDAFLRAPDWESRIPYVFQGESLRPAMEEYYKKWPFTRHDRFALNLFQMEQDTEMGGPYWVYLVSASDEDQGYPVIVRVEDGNLKVDWEIYSEFQDQHFSQFLKGSIASPHTFRLVIQRASGYYGPDRSEFTELDDHLVYEINPPYGDLGEFSEYAFVKRDSELAKKLDEVVGLNDEPLAVIITLEQKKFSHGVTHEVITDYVTEGWFR